ncbi:hypothetical protein DFH06DRAFT_1320034 [Mycena polygramma]|nr:hypothetical protein DFH06DRAFT_1320034 [Mycena polygramma]
MLSFPQASNSTDLVDGCPLVRLTDSETEVEVFLKALFDPEFFIPFPSQTEWTTIVGCLRLSHKYGVDYLRRRALIHLSSGFDTTLSCWDAQLMYNGDTNYPPVPKTSWTLPTRVAEDIVIIRLAREVEAPWILPDAFYCLAAQSTVIGANVYESDIYKGMAANLSLQDHQVFLNGLRTQTQAGSFDILRFLSYPLDIAGCVTSHRCHRDRLSAIENIRDSILVNPSNPLNIWGRLGLARQSTRQTFWDKLPEIYGLPSWEELEEMKVAAIGTTWIA